MPCMDKCAMSRVSRDFPVTNKVFSIDNDCHKAGTSHIFAYAEVCLEVTIQNAAGLMFYECFLHHKEQLAQPSLSQGLGTWRDNLLEQVCLLVVVPRLLLGSHSFAV
eukprot:1043127-Pelagomonas_calceolata.AAC.4